MVEDNYVVMYRQTEKKLIQISGWPPSTHTPSAASMWQEIL